MKANLFLYGFVGAVSGAALSILALVIMMMLWMPFTVLSWAVVLGMILTGFLFGVFAFYREKTERVASTADGIVNETEGPASDQSDSRKKDENISPK